MTTGREQESSGSLPLPLPPFSQVFKEGQVVRAQDKED